MTRVRKTKRVVLIAIINLTLLLTGCSGHGFDEVTVRDIPVETAHFKMSRDSVKAILDVAQQEVSKHLPNAYPISFVYTGDCDALPNMQGRINMLFVQVNKIFLWRRLLTAFVSVDMSRGMMDIEYLDYTSINLRTDPLAFTTNEISFSEVTEVAYSYIVESQVTNCDVTITRTRQAWIVRCGPIENFVQECLFRVDPFNGEITPLEESRF